MRIALACAALATLWTAPALAAEAPVYDIPANCKMMADMAGTPEIAAGCVRDETDAKAQIEKNEVPADIMSRCRVEGDDQKSYVVLWGCIRDALAGASTDMPAAP